MAVVDIALLNCVDGSSLFHYYLKVSSSIYNLVLCWFARFECKSHHPLSWFFISSVVLLLSASGHYGTLQHLLSNTINCAKERENATRKINQ